MIREIISFLFISRCMFFKVVRASYFHKRYLREILFSDDLCAVGEQRLAPQLESFGRGIISRRALFRRPFARYHAGISCERATC